MRKSLVTAAAAALLLAACSSGSSSDNSTSSPTPSPVEQAPSVVTMNLKSDVHCSSGEVPVRVRYATADSSEVSISVDGNEEITGAPVAGATRVRVKCTDGTHEVALTASNAAGETSTETHQIRTVKAPPAPAPVIRSFNVVPGQCEGSTLAVTAQYATANAASVSFEVDGQAPGAQAGLDTSGSANVPDVPCDGKSHQITLVATSAAGQSVQATQIVKGEAKPIITSFTAASQVHCQGDQVAVKVSWAASGTKSTEVTVDNTVAVKGQPASGSAEVEVPCTQGSHRIGLIATNDTGQQASVAHTIKTIPGGAATKPVINSFDLTSPGCKGKFVRVIATYSTTNADAVAFEIDGDDPGMQAGLPTSGKANVPDVPCDGNSHQITLVATGSDGKSVQQSQTVGPLYASAPTN